MYIGQYYILLVGNMNFVKVVFVGKFSNLFELMIGDVVWGCICFFYGQCNNGIVWFFVGVDIVV